MTTPRIGLSTYRTPGQMTIYDGELAVLPSQYIESVTRAGGLAVMIPPQPLTIKDATSILSGLDGLIITGGADINPSRYGQERGPHTAEPEDLRDSLEDTLLSAAREMGMPILGICRGAQMLNVHLGEPSTSTYPTLSGTTGIGWAMGCFTPNP